MADRTATRQMLTIGFLCVLWYIVSSSNNVIGKWILSEFPYPMTVTMVQLTSITLYSGPFFNLWGVRKYVDISWRYYFKFIVPLALGKFLASVTSHISIWKVPVSYAHTVERVQRGVARGATLRKTGYVDDGYAKDPKTIGGLRNPTTTVGGT
ncbi:solute carrier family 35 member E1 homolog [Culex quinquefasciatus]|uniref:solute carrier family 35 member E1 homolog n=1 Tax=Culex quinquefasciatus TaxID=7176 RepID=UPI0018E36E61|nr:solute carrier family 35 member E1 homolog [Culex quinquefasciatus]